MADDAENDDQWLYGEASEQLSQENDKDQEEPEQPADEPKDPEKDDHQPEEEEPETDAEPPADDDKLEEPRGENDDENGTPEDGEIEKQPGDSDKEDFDEDSDDDVNVVIGDIKTSTTYTSLNIKRGGLLTTSGTTDKSKQSQQAGKFNVEEFDQPGLINGVAATDFNLDSLEDKPWRKVGADVTDYFNYGFNEDTWKAYCERQKRLRMNESGVGLAPLNAIGMPRGPVPIMNDNSKYSGNYTTPRGLSARMGTVSGKMDAPKENVIQVMTADRREYSRKPPGFPDMSMPPPNFEDFQPEYGFNPEPEPFYGGYEPTQDSQWGGSEPTNAGWQPQEIKPLTSSSSGPAPPMVPPVGAPVGPPPSTTTSVGPSSGGGPSSKDGASPPPPSAHREARAASRGRSEKPAAAAAARERDRERAHRRERSRSRSRRHKSRSPRSPGHRAHRKKKSRRHEDSD